MAFETLTPLISYPSDGVITQFDIPDKFYEASDIKVFFIDADGEETQFEFGVDYSVIITATDPTPPARKSGRVSFVTPPEDDGAVVVFIWPDVDQDQPFEGQPVTPRQNERVHDRHSMRDAALRELLFRGFRSPLNAPPGLRYIEIGAPGTAPIFAPDGSGSLIEGPNAEDIAGAQEQAAAAAAAAAAAENSATIAQQAVEDAQAIVSDGDKGGVIVSGAGTVWTPKFLGIGAAAVLTNIQSALRDRKPALTDYGVGAHGVKGAFERARDALVAEFANGGTLLIPEGDWTIDGGAVVFDQDGVVLEGGGKGGTRILNANTDTPAIQMGANLITRNRMGASGLVFGAASGIVSVAGSSGLRVIKTASFTARDIEAYNFPAALNRGFEFISSSALVIDDVSSQGCLDAGQVYNDVLDVKFIAARSDSNVIDGFLFSGAEGIYGSNVTAYGNGRHAFALRTHVSRPNIHWFINGWVGDTSGSDNWSIEDLQTAYLTACWGCTQQDDMVNPAANGFFLYSNKCRNIWFIGGNASNNNGNGVTLFDDGTAPRDIEVQSMNLGFSESTFMAPNGRGGVGTGLGADAACTGIRVAAGRSEGNPTGAFSAVGIQSIKEVRGYVNRRSGEVSGNTDVNGDITFDPTMDEVPIDARLSFSGSYPVHAQVLTMSASAITAKVMNVSDGSPLVSSAVTFRYTASGARALSS